MSTGLRLRPCTVRRAVAHVAAVHRHLPKVQGGMWAVGAWTGAELVGVAIVGHPARELMADTLCVLRVAVGEHRPNACSMLYGACARAARAMGADNLVTYTLPEERGTSLIAAGWVYGGITEGRDHGRPSRQRRPAVDARPKHRWWAPWSTRAVKVKFCAAASPDQCDKPFGCSVCRG